MSRTDPAERIDQLESENSRLRRLLDQQGVSSTLRHQVRNALGMLRAILRRSAESKSTVGDFVAHLEGRLDALLRVQSLLISNPDGRADLYAVVSNELVAHAMREGEQASIRGPTVRIEPRMAELLSLVIHELMTNAVKFGAMSVAGGRIDVSWKTTSAPPTIVLIWAESGHSLTDPAPSFRGFGMEAIEGMLPYQLKAESKMEFLTDGLRCTLRLPIAAAPS